MVNASGLLPTWDSISFNTPLPPRSPAGSTGSLPILQMKGLRHRREAMCSRSHSTQWPVQELSPGFLTLELSPAAPISNKLRSPSWPPILTATPVSCQEVVGERGGGRWSGEESMSPCLSGTWLSHQAAYLPRRPLPCDLPQDTAQPPWLQGRGAQENRAAWGLR